MAVVLLHDGIDRREAQARAGLLGREVGVEDPGEILLLDALARVGDCNLDVIPLAQAGMTLAVMGIVAGHDPQRAAAGHGLDGIDHKVLHDPADLALVGVGRPEIGRHVVEGLDLRAVEREGGHLAHNGLELHRRADGFTALGEGQQLLGEVARAQGGLLRRAEAGAGGAVGGNVKLGEGQVAHDGRKDVVEIVGDAARQHAHRLQPRRAHQLLLQALLLGDIAENEHRADHLAVRGVDGGAAALDLAAPAVPREQSRVRGEVGDRVAPGHAGNGHLHHLVRAGVLQPADFLNRPALDLLRPPARQLGRRRIHVLDQARHVGGDDTLVHRPERDRQPFLLGRQRLLSAAHRCDVKGHADQRILVLTDPADRHVLADPDHAAIVPDDMKHLLVSIAPLFQGEPATCIHLGFFGNIKITPQDDFFIRFELPKESKA